MLAVAARAARRAAAAATAPLRAPLPAAGAPAHPCCRRATRSLAGAAGGQAGSMEKAKLMGMVKGFADKVKGELGPRSRAQITCMRLHG